MSKLDLEYEFYHICTHMKICSLTRFERVGRKCHDVLFFTNQQAVAVADRGYVKTNLQQHILEYTFFTFPSILDAFPVVNSVIFRNSKPI